MALDIFCDVWHFGPDDPAKLLALLTLADGATYDRAIVRLNERRLAAFARVPLPRVPALVSELVNDGWLTPVASEDGNYRIAVEFLKKQKRARDRKSLGLEVAA